MSKVSKVVTGEQEGLAEAEPSESGSESSGASSSSGGSKVELCLPQPPRTPVRRPRKTTVTDSERKKRRAEYSRAYRARKKAENAMLTGTMTPGRQRVKNLLRLHLNECLCGSTEFWPILVVCKIWCKGPLQYRSLLTSVATCYGARLRIQSRYGHLGSVRSDPRNTPAVPTWRCAAGVCVVSGLAWRIGAVYDRDVCQFRDS